MIHRAGSCHIGGNLSVAEIMGVLAARTNVTKELGPDEDRVIQSEGWLAASMFWFLAHKGVIPKEHLDRFYQEGEKDYLGLLETSVRGIWATTGSVGWGLPVGAGMALAKKLQDRKGIVYVIEGDGGIQTGPFHEALQIAAHQKLDNLVLLINRNRRQAMGDPRGILGAGSLPQRLWQFGWTVRLTTDGNNTAQIEADLREWPKGKPLAVICDTVKCKGIPSLEGKTETHYCPPTNEQFEEGMRLCLT